MGDHWTTVFPSESVRSAVGHLFTAGQWPEAHVRLFADWLRRHTSARDRYASLKRDLLARGVWSNEYTKAKDPFVLRSANQARAELGLPQQLVRCKTGRTALTLRLGAARSNVPSADVRHSGHTSYAAEGRNHLAVVRAVGHRCVRAAAASAYRTMRISTSPSRSGSTCSVPSAVNPFFS